MRIRLLIILFLLVFPVMAQTEYEKAVIRHERLRMIDFHHVNLGVEVDAHNNQFMGAAVSYGVGTYRNLLNHDFGIKYVMANPIGRSEKERISVHYLPVWAATNVNLMRWHQGSVYVGGGNIL